MKHTLLAAALLAALPLAQAAGFSLASPDIQPDSTIDQRFEFDGFGCSGQNRSPALQWSGAPAGARSFVVTVFDPDAPTGSGFWHWIVVDIPANVHELPADAGAVGNAHLPRGASQLRNDYGSAAWGGVCPPPGDRPHRYVFTVYALKTARLGVPDSASPALALSKAKANAIAQASFTAKYGRKP